MLASAYRGCSVSTIAPRSEDAAAINRREAPACESWCINKLAWGRVSGNGEVMRSSYLVLSGQVVELDEAMGFGACGCFVSPTWH